MLTRKRTPVLEYVIGVDLSLTGPAAVSAGGDPLSRFEDLTAFGTWRVDAPLDELRGPERLEAIFASFVAWLDVKITARGKPRIAVLEGYGFSSQQAHSLGELGGLIKHALYMRGIALLVVPPANLKQFCSGKGNSEKNTMMRDALHRWGYMAANDNDNDAFVAAMIGLCTMRGVLKKAEVGYLEKKCDVIAPLGGLDLEDEERSRLLAMQRPPKKRKKKGGAS